MVFQPVGLVIRLFSSLDVYLYCKETTAKWSFRYNCIYVEMIFLQVLPECFHTSGQETWPKLCIEWPQFRFHSSKQCCGGTSKRAKCHCWFEAAATAESEVGSVWARRGMPLWVVWGGPQIPFYITASQKKRLTRQRARGVEIKATRKSRQKSMQAHEKTNTVEGITSQLSSLYFPEQLSQFLWSACSGEDCAAVWQLERKGFSTCHRRVDKHSCCGSLLWLDELSVWTSPKFCMCAFVYLSRRGEGVWKLSWQVDSK